VIVVCHGHSAWEESWARPLYEGYAREATMLYVHPDAGARSRASARDLRRRVREAARAPGLLVLEMPGVLPGGRWPAIGRANRWLALRTLLGWLQRDTEEPVVLIVQRSYLLPTIRGLPAALRVYEVTDDYPGYATGTRQAARIAGAHRRFLRDCDLVWATSSTLVEDIRPLRPDVYETSMGVDFNAFARGAAGPVPDALARIPRPRVGLVGRLEDRIDWRLIEALAGERPDWQVVLVGPLYCAGRATLDALRRLALRPNFHHLSAVPEADMPVFVGGLDVCLIPYRVEGANLGINPLKLYQSLAAGRPVVATPLPAVQPFRDVVACAASPVEFVAAVAAALSIPDDDAAARARRQRVRAFDWHDIAAHQLRIARAALAARRRGMARARQDGVVTAEEPRRA
jgi:glycosyltransferase involved in cell wall biosynthesis